MHCQCQIGARLCLHVGADCPCLYSRNNNSFRFSKGDLFLCDTFEKFRSPGNDQRQAAAEKSTQQSVHAAV